MRPWRDAEPPAEPAADRDAGADGGGGRQGTPHSLLEALTELRAEHIRGGGAEIGTHRHGEIVHSHLEPHPHQRGAGAPTVGIVGAGRVGTALGVAIHRAGWPVPAFATRDPASRERFERLVPGARAFPEPAALLDEVEMTILAVPDDVIPEIAESMRLYAGQILIHTSGLLGADVLRPALAAGSQIGAFHPLVSFTSEIESSVEAIRGATIALEGDDAVLGLLADLAEALGGLPVRLPRGTKVAYHAAATLASGGLVALLDGIAALAEVAGLDERGALAVYGRLTEQTLGNAKRQGIAEALTGPVARGDVGTIEAHLDALRRFVPDLLGLYAAAAERELEIARRRGFLAPEAADRVAAVLAKGL